MKPIIVVNGFYPPGMSWTGQTIYPFIFIKPWSCTAQTIRHELIHCKQVREHGWVPFHASWLWQLIRGWIVKRSYGDAYKAISFEAEAYAKQDDPNFLPADLEALVLPNVAVY